MEVIEVWRKWKDVTRELRGVLLDANHFARFVAIVQDETEQRLREYVDAWDNKNRFRKLIAWAGLDPIVEFSRGFADHLLRHYLGPEE